MSRVRALEPNVVPGHNAPIFHGLHDRHASNLDPLRPRVPSQVVLGNAGVEAAFVQSDVGNVDDAGHGASPVRGVVGEGERRTRLEGET